MAQRWAHRLQACIVSKIGNCFFAVRLCNFFCGKRAQEKIVTLCDFFFCGKWCNFLFAVNVCDKKRHVVYFFFFAVNVCTKKSSSRVIFFLR